MRNFTQNRFPIKNLLIDSLLTPIVESTYLNMDMWKFKSSQKLKAERSRLIPRKHAETPVLLSAFWLGFTQQILSLGFVLFTSFTCFLFLLNTSFKTVRKARNLSRKTHLEICARTNHTLLFSVNFWVCCSHANKQNHTSRDGSSSGLLLDCPEKSLDADNSKMSWLWRGRMNISLNVYVLLSVETSYFWHGFTWNQRKYSNHITVLSNHIAVLLCVMIIETHTTLVQKYDVKLSQAFFTGKCFSEVFFFGFIKYLTRENLFHMLTF